MAQHLCPIWQTECESITQAEGSVIVTDSPRAGGSYQLYDNAVAELGNLTYDEKARLTTLLVRQRQRGNDCPRIDASIITRAKSANRTGMEERLMNLLRFLEGRGNKAGEPVAMRFDLNRQPSFGNIQGGVFDWHNTHYGLAHSECIHLEELDYLTDGLVGRGLIEKNDQIPNRRGNPVPTGYGIICRVTVNGYIIIEQLQTEFKPDQCFVAMWFKAETRDLYDKAIAPAVKAAGYLPLLIENKIDLIGTIDDEVIAEIRRSRFVIADFTHGDDGARGSVYYEAGFARGLDIPVIFTCRDDQIGVLHFDINHFLHLPWCADAPEELIQPLKDRITANIGVGPHATGGE